LKTALIQGKDIPDFDQQIIYNLLVTKVEVDIAMQEQILVGIRNASREIYRIIGASSIKQFNNASEELEELGLRNELGENESGEIEQFKHIYKAIFSLD